MKKLLFAFAVLTSSVVVYAQSPEATIRCGAHTYLKQMQEYFPEEYAAVLKADEEYKAAAGVTTTYKTNGGVYTIPVVVHIVYKLTNQDIDDEFVYSQIEVLNEDYRRLNDDADETPVAFSGLAEDAQIEFCLAQQDPDGFLHSGITRTETDITSWSLFVSPTADNFADNVKFTDKGGEDAWPRADYLNIWVCNLGAGLLGYATPPGGLASKDGVVIGYKYFGDGSPGGAYNKGRTATHEVGHWLGLNHIWGDDDFDPEPQCDGTDWMDDTPSQEDATYGDPSFPRLDDCSPSSPGIMFMNYMDYSDDGAMNMFTSDQVNKMRTILSTTRSSLSESQACEPGIEVGVNEVLKSQLIQLSVYPNPSAGDFMFEMKNFENETVTLEIFNLTGEVIDRIILQNAPELHVNFSGAELPAGSYLVKASDGEYTLTQNITVVK